MLQVVGGTGGEQRPGGQARREDRTSPTRRAPRPADPPSPVPAGQVHGLQEVRHDVHDDRGQPGVEADLVDEQGRLTAPTRARRAG